MIQVELVGFQETFAFTPNASAIVPSMQAQPVQGFNMAQLQQKHRFASAWYLLACLMRCFRWSTHPERNAAAATQVGIIITE